MISSATIFNVYLVINYTDLWIVMSAMQWFVIAGKFIVFLYLKHLILCFVLIVKDEKRKTSLNWHSLIKINQIT